MKPILRAIFIVAIAVLFTAPSITFAQTSDTVRVYANPPGSGGLTIDQVIMADTNSTGNPKDPNRVWLLQQTNTSIDTPYYYQNTINVKGNITIIGERNPVTGMPPLLQPWKNINNTAPSYLIAESGDSCTITLKNVYTLGQRYDSVQATRNVLQITGQDVRAVLDHCVFDNNTDYAAYFLGTATGGSIFATNCEMRNVSDQFWRAGALFWANSPAAMDSVVIQNCTFFLEGRCIYGGPVPFGYLLLDHNTLFFSSDAPLLSDHQINATITNNIFYGADAHGADSTLISKAQTNDAAEPYGIIMMDSTSKYGIAEASRKVVVENNVYFWPDTMFGFWKTVDDTASTRWWYIVPPSWMNRSTLQKFNDKTNWPGFVSANNDSVDPGFDQSLVTSAVNSLLKFEYQIYQATKSGSYGTASSRWWQYWTNPYPYYYFNQVPSTWKGWGNGYPAPENLRYSNTSLMYAGTDGKALGDLNWFPEQLTSSPPPSPLLVSPNGMTGVPRKATMTWNSSTDATQYHLQIANNAAFSASAVDVTTPDTSLQISDTLSASTKYYWHVAALNSVFTSPYSAVDSFTTGTVVLVINGPNGLPTEYALFQNYPNPFNPSTVIKYNIPKAQLVTLKVYNVLGQEVATLVNARQNAGYYTVTFNADHFASGVYFYILKAGDFTSTRKQLLLK